MEKEFVKLSSEKLIKIQEHVDKKKNNEYEVIEFFKHENRNKSRITVKHKVCNFTRTIGYYRFLKSDYKCTCITKIKPKIGKYTVSDLQKVVNENFGEKVFEIIEIENGLYSNVTIKHKKCGTIFIVKGNVFSRLREYNCKCGEKVISHLNRNVVPLNVFKEKLFEKTGGRILYRDGYKGLNTPCKFYDKKCGREFEIKPDFLLTFNYNCPLCAKNEDKEKSIKLWQSRFDFYKVNDIIDRKLHMECKICHKKIVSSFMKNGNKLALCDCEKKLKRKITDDLLNININGKTENMSTFLKEDTEFLLDLAKHSFVTYEVKDNMNEYIISETDKYIITSRVNDIVRDTLLTYKKVNFKFNNFKYVDKNKKASFKLLSFTAIDVNKFNIRRIFNTVIERNNGDIYDFNFYIDESHLFHLTSDEYKDNVYVNKSIGLCFRLLLLFNKRYSYTNDIKDYESNSTIIPNEDKNDSTNIIEYKELKLDLTKNRIRVINKGHTTRKISCNFEVSSHFRHYNKNGKTIFIKSFEKGKEFKNIRRIEKTYIVK